MLMILQLRKDLLKDCSYSKIQWNNNDTDFVKNIFQTRYNNKKMSTSRY